MIKIKDIRKDLTGRFDINENYYFENGKKFEIKAPQLEWNNEGKWQNYMETWIRRIKKYNIDYALEVELKPLIYGSITIEDGKMAKEIIEILENENIEYELYIDIE